MQPVSFQPTIKRPIVDPFQRKQNTNGDDFARIQVRVGPLVDMHQFVIYHTKESNDYLFGSHQVVLLFAMILLLAQESHNLLSFANPTFQLATLVILFACPVSGDIIPQPIPKKLLSSSHMISSITVRVAVRISAHR